jgi:hypothetical protein
MSDPENLDDTVFSPIPSSHALDGGELPPGTFAGSYEIEHLIGNGGCGSVYLTTHPTLGRPVALKVLNRILASSPKMVTRFLREIALMKIVRHPSIADIYDCGTLEDGRPFFVMELLTGPALDAFIRDRGRLPPEEALDILEPVCLALQSAHEAGIVHRDIKPSNIVFTLTGVDRAAHDLLRGHGRGRADERADGRETPAVAVGFEELGDAEIEELHGALAVVEREGDVARLDVAVNDPRLVRRLQGEADRLKDVEHLVGREPPAAPEDRVEGRSCEELHDEEGPAVVEGAAIVDVGQGRVADDPHQGDLAEEAGHHLGRGDEEAVQHLDRDLPPERGVGGQVDGAAAAIADEALDFVAACHRPRRELAGLGGARALDGAHDGFVEAHGGIHKLLTGSS